MTSLPNLVSAAEKHRLRRHQRDAGVERRLPQPLLHDGLGFGELRLGVDAAHFVLLDFDRDRLRASCRAAISPHRSDRIRPCDCHCRSAPGFPAPPCRRAPSARHCRERWCARCRWRRRARGWRRVPSPLRHQPAVAGRVGRPEAEHRDRRALGERAAQSRQRLRPDQRRVAEDDQDVVGALLRSPPWPPAPRAPCRAARAARTPARSAHAPRFGGNIALLGADHDGDRGRPGAAARRQAHGRAASGPRSHAAPWAATSACACLRRPRARSPGRFARSFRLRPGRGGHSRMQAKGHVRDESANVFNKVIRGGVVALVGERGEAWPNRNPARNWRQRSGNSACATCGGWRCGACPPPAR